MKTIEIEIYKFEELSEEIQNKLIDQNRYTFMEDFYFEDVSDNFEYENKDFKIEKTYWSGFHSQGDGAMFLYSSISKKFFRTLLEEKGLSKLKIDILVQNICLNSLFYNTHYGRYYHENSCIHHLSNDYHAYPNIQEVLFSLEEPLVKEYKNQCGKLYKDLDETNTWLTSEEFVKEELLIQDLYYFENGREY